MEDQNTPAYISFSKDLATGNALIDDQHGRMVELINDLHHEMLVNGNDNVAASLIESIRQYTKQHFTTEEAILESAGYPDLENHKQLHAAMTEKTNQIAREFFAHEQQYDAYEMLKFLKNWWMEHISKTDQRYSAYVKSHM